MKLSLALAVNLLRIRAVSYIVPSFALIGLFAVAVWLWGAIATLPGGWKHMTAGTRLVLFGFTGLGVLIIFSVVVIVTVVEAVLVERTAPLHTDVIVNQQQLARLEQKLTHAGLLEPLDEFKGGL